MCTPWEDVCRCLEGGVLSAVVQTCRICSGNNYGCMGEGRWLPGICWEFA